MLKDEAWVPSGSTKPGVLSRDKRPSREHAIKPSVKAELDMAREYLRDKHVCDSYIINPQPPLMSAKVKSGGLRGNRLIA